MVKAQLLGYAGQRAPTRGCAGRQAVEQRAAVVQPPRYRSCTPQPVRGNAALRHGAHHPPPEPNSGSAEPEAAARRPDRQRESVRSQHAHQCRHVRRTVAQVRAGRQVWFRTVGRSRYTFRGGPGEAPWGLPETTSVNAGQVAAKASVGARRAARIAGYRPAIAPISTVAPTPPARTHNGTTVGHLCIVAYVPVTR